MTAIPSAPALPAARLVPAHRRALPVEAPDLESFAPPAPEVEEQEPVSRAPRIELGFRDGSTAALAPGSDQAKALSDIASVLTQRD